MANDLWSQGKINGYEHWVKHYETGSEYGIGNGKISKLSIRKEGKEIYNYDRGLDFDRLDEEGRTVYVRLLKKYN